jgi:hypothetical protein
MADPVNDQVTLDANAAAAAAKQAQEAAAAEETRKAAEAAANQGKSQAERDADMVAKVVQEKVDAQLLTIKQNLDKAFAQRDEALAKAAILEQKERDATLKQLESEGKHKEAYEMRLAEANAKNEALQKKNTELSRDVSVREALKSFEFKNDKSSDMAFRELCSNLVQNDAGQWVHRSGVSIRDYASTFAKDSENEFLFKVKVNSGGGTTNPNPDAKAGVVNEKPSLFKLSQEEVIARAAKGEFGPVPTF